MYQVKGKSKTKQPETKILYAIKSNREVTIRYFSKHKPIRALTN
jgi:hypothetical protein